MNSDFVLVSEGSGEYLTSPLMNKYKIPHMFTTRNGGVSSGEFYSFNFSVGQGSVKDTLSNVEMNYQIAAKNFNCGSGDICKVYQMHTKKVKIANSKDKGTVLGNEKDGADGLITDDEDVLLSVRTADCVPVLLYDIKSDICAALHSGWRGSVQGIVAEGISIMKNDFNSSPENIIAAIGPCAKVCCYEVGAEVFEMFKDLSEDFIQGFWFHKDKIYLDLASIIEMQLVFGGLERENISNANLCTICNPKLFFSHRRQGMIRGTMGAFIKVRNS